MNIIESTNERLQGLWRHVSEKYPPERAWFYWPPVKFFELLHNDLVSGKPMANYFFLIPPELLRSLDVAMYSAEYAGSLIVTFPGGLVKYFDIAEEYIPDHLCGLHKFMLGAAMAGDIPHPDLLVHTSSLSCDSATAIHSGYANYFDIPHFCLDVPYWQDERGYKYFAGQLERMVSFIEEQTKQKLDLDRLRQAMEYSNQAHEYLRKINELRKVVPSPLTGRAGQTIGSAVMGLAGTPELVDWLKTGYELAEARVQKGEAAVPNERMRLVWLYLTPIFDLSIIEWLENEYGAVAVMDMMCNYVTEPADIDSGASKIFEALAFKTMKAPMVRQQLSVTDIYIEDAIKLCKEYKADAAIFGGHIACKTAWASAKLVKDAIYDELGIPTFTFELDAYDPRVISAESIKAQLEQFLSIVR